MWVNALNNQLFTLCVYAQQGYVCLVVSVCVYICIYVAKKTWLFEVLLLENLSLVQSTAHLLSLTAKKKELTTPGDSFRERNSEAFY